MTSEAPTHLPDPIAIDPWIDENGFLRAKTNAGPRRRDAVESTLNKAQGLVDGPVPMVCDVRGLTSLEPQAWA